MSIGNSNDTSDLYNCTCNIKQSSDRTCKNCGHVWSIPLDFRERIFKCPIKSHIEKIKGYDGGDVNGKTKFKCTKCGYDPYENHDYCDDLGVFTPSSMNK